MNCCLANLLLTPFNASVGEIENSGTLPQVGGNSVVILYQDKRTHARGHQERYEKQGREEDHSPFVKHEFSYGDHLFLSFAIQCWSRVWTLHFHRLEDRGSSLEPQPRPGSFLWRSAKAHHGERHPPRRNR